MGDEHVNREERSGMTRELYAGRRQRVEKWHDERVICREETERREVA